MGWTLRLPASAWASSWILGLTVPVSLFCALVESLPAPVLVTRRGRGALPDPHPLNFGLIETPNAEAILRRADITVAIGEALLTRFVLPFELLGVLFLAALLGAIYFARPDE